MDDIIVDCMVVTETAAAVANMYKIELFIVGSM